MEVLEVVLTRPGDDDLITLRGHPTRLATGFRVNVLQELVLVRQVEVLLEVAGSFFTRAPTERHVQRDETRPLEGIRGLGPGLGLARRPCRLCGRGGLCDRCD